MADCQVYRYNAVPRGGKAKSCKPKDDCWRTLCVRKGDAIPRRIFTDSDDMLEDHELFQKALAERLRTLRKERGFSLRDMTVRFGYAESQWKRVEREGVGTTQSLLRIAKAFQTTVANLLDGLGEYPSARATRRNGQGDESANSARAPLPGDSPRVASWSEDSATIKRTSPHSEDADTGAPAQAKQKFAD